MTEEAQRALAERLLPTSNRLLRQVALAELLGPPPAVERRRLLLAKQRGEHADPHRRGRLD